MPAGTKRGVVRSSSFVRRPVFHVYVVLLQMTFGLILRWKNLLNSFAEASVFLIKSMLIL